MPSYLERYLSGEHEQVWRELTTLGSAVREEPLYTDALAVATETMRRVRYNLEIIISRLYKSGYLFKNYNTAFIPPASDTESKILIIEEHYQLTLPLSLKLWYSTVGSVDFTGFHPQWAYPICLRGALPTIAQIEEYSAKFGRNPTVVMADPLQIAPFTMALKSVIADAESNNILRHIYKWADKHSEVAAGSFEVVMSEDEPTKAGYGSGGGLSIYIPNLSADAVLSYTPNIENGYFVSYLRRSLEWGGFPGFADVEESLRPTEMLEYLKEGLLPI